MLGIEEEQVKAMCEKLLIEFKPDLVFTEKGVSGMCTNHRYEGDVVYQRRPLQISRNIIFTRPTSQHFVGVRKSDSNQIARLVSFI